MRKATEAPKAVRIFYRPADNRHIFTSEDLPGLFLSETDLKHAFEILPKVVSDIVHLESGIQAQYLPNATLKELERKLDKLDPRQELVLRRNDQAAMVAA